MATSTSSTSAGSNIHKLQQTTDRLRLETTQLRERLRGERDAVRALRAQHAAELRKERTAARHKHVQLKMQLNAAKVAPVETIICEKCAKLRAIHEAEVRKLNVEFKKKELQLKGQLNDMKREITVMNPVNGVCHTCIKLNTELSKQKEASKDLEDRLQKAIDADRLKAADLRAQHENHVTELSRITRSNKHDAHKLLEELKTKDRIIEQLRRNAGKVRTKGEDSNSATEHAQMRKLREEVRKNEQPALLAPVSDPKPELVTNHDKFRRNEVVELKVTIKQRGQMTCGGTNEDLIEPSLEEDTDSAVSSAPSSLSPQPCSPLNEECGPIRRVTTINGLQTRSSPPLTSLSPQPSEGYTTPPPGLWPDDDEEHSEQENSELSMVRRQVRELERALLVTRATKSSRHVIAFTERVRQLEEHEAELLREIGDLREQNELLEFRVLELAECQDKPSLSTSSWPISDYRDASTATDDVVEQFNDEPFRQRLTEIIEKIEESEDKKCLLQVLVLLDGLEELSKKVEPYEVTAMQIYNEREQTPPFSITSVKGVRDRTGPDRDRLVAKVPPFTGRTADSDDDRDSLVRSHESSSSPTPVNSRGTQTDGVKVVSEEESTKSLNLTAEVRKLDKLRETIEVVGNRNGRLVVSGGNCIGGCEQKHIRQLEFYRERVDVLERKLSVYESSGELQARHLAERLSREVCLEAQVKQLNATIYKLQSENSRLEEERCELEEAENDTRLRCQRLEADILQLERSRMSAKRRAKDSRQQATYWEGMVNKYEERNYELEERECELRHRLEVMEKTAPAILLFNMWKMVQDDPKFDVAGATLDRLKRAGSRTRSESSRSHSRSPLRKPSCLCDQYDDKIKNLEFERNKLIEQKQAMEDKVRSLESQLKDLKVSSTKVVPPMSGQSITSLMSGDFELMNAVQELKERENEMRKRIEDLEHREAAYMETLQQADEIWAEMENGYKKRITDVEQSEADMRDRLHRLEKHKPVNYDELEDSEREMAARAEKLYRENNRLQAENKRLEKTLNACLEDKNLEKESKADKLNGELERERRRSQALEQRLVDDEAALAEALRAHSAEIETLRERLSRTSNELVHLEVTNGELREEVDTLESKITELERGSQERAVADEQIIRRLTQELNDRDKELSSLKEKNSAAQAGERLGSALQGVKACEICSTSVSPDLVETVEGVRTLCQLVSCPSSRPPDDAQVSVRSKNLKTIPSSTKKPCIPDTCEKLNKQTRTAPQNLELPPSKEQICSTEVCEKILSQRTDPLNKPDYTAQSVPSSKASSVSKLSSVDLSEGLSEATSKKTSKSGISLNDEQIPPKDQDDGIDQTEKPTLEDSSFAGLEETPTMFVTYSGEIESVARDTKGIVSEGPSKTSAPESALLPVDVVSSTVRSTHEPTSTTKDQDDGIDQTEKSTLEDSSFAVMEETPPMFVTYSEPIDRDTEGVVPEEPSITNAPESASLPVAVVSSTVRSTHEPTSTTKTCPLAKDKTSCSEKTCSAPCAAPCDSVGTPLINVQKPVSQPVSTTNTIPLSTQQIRRPSLETSTNAMVCPFRKAGNVCDKQSCFAPCQIQVPAVSSTQNANSLQISAKEQISAVSSAQNAISLQMSAKDQVSTVSSAKNANSQQLSVKEPVSVSKSVQQEICPIALEYNLKNSTPGSTCVQKSCKASCRNSVSTLAESQRAVDMYIDRDSTAKDVVATSSIPSIEQYDLITEVAVAGPPPYQAIRAEVDIEPGEEPKGVTIITAITNSGNLEVSTKSPLGLVDHTMVSTPSGNMELTTAFIPRTMQSLEKAPSYFHREREPAAPDINQTLHTLPPNDVLDAMPQIQSAIPVDQVSRDVANTDKVIMFKDIVPSGESSKVSFGSKSSDAKIFAKIDTSGIPLLLDESIPLIEQSTTLPDISEKPSTIVNDSQPIIPVSLEESPDAKIFAKIDTSGIPLLLDESIPLTEQSTTLPDMSKKSSLIVNDLQPEISVSLEESPDAKIFAKIDTSGIPLLLDESVPLIEQSTNLPDISEKISTTSPVCNLTDVEEIPWPTENVLLASAEILAIEKQDLNDNEQILKPTDTNTEFTEPVTLDNMESRNRHSVTFIPEESISQKSSKTIDYSVQSSEMQANISNQKLLFESQELIVHTYDKRQKPTERKSMEEHEELLTASGESLVQLLKDVAHSTEKMAEILERVSQFPQKGKIEVPAEKDVITPVSHTRSVDLSYDVSSESSAFPTPSQKSPKEVSVAFQDGESTNLSDTFGKTLQCTATTPRESITSNLSAKELNAMETLPLESTEASLGSKASKLSSDENNKIEESTSQHTKTTLSSKTSRLSEEKSKFETPLASETISTDEVKTYYQTPEGSVATELDKVSDVMPTKEVSSPMIEPSEIVPKRSLKECICDQETQIPMKDIPTALRPKDCICPTKQIPEKDMKPSKAQDPTTDITTRISSSRPKDCTCSTMKQISKNDTRSLENDTFQIPVKDVSDNYKKPQSKSNVAICTCPSGSLPLGLYQQPQGSQQVICVCTMYKENSQQTQSCAPPNSLQGGSPQQQQMLPQQQQPPLPQFYSPQQQQMLPQQQQPPLPQFYSSYIPCPAYQYTPYPSSNVYPTSVQYSPQQMSTYPQYGPQQVPPYQQYSSPNPQAVCSPLCSGRKPEPPRQEPMNMCEKYACPAYIQHQETVQEEVKEEVKGEIQEEVEEELQVEVEEELQEEVEEELQEEVKEELQEEVKEEVKSFELCHEEQKQIESEAASYGTAPESLSVSLEISVDEQSVSEAPVESETTSEGKEISSEKSKESTHVEDLQPEVEVSEIEPSISEASAAPSTPGVEPETMLTPISSTAVTEPERIITSTPSTPGTEPGTIITTPILSTPDMEPATKITTPTPSTPIAELEEVINSPVIMSPIDDQSKASTIRTSKTDRSSLSKIPVPISAVSSKVSKSDEPSIKSSSPKDISIKSMESHKSTPKDIAKRSVESSKPPSKDKLKRGSDISKPPSKDQLKRGSDISKPKQPSITSKSPRGSAGSVSKKIAPSKHGQDCTCKECKCSPCKDPKISPRKRPSFSPSEQPSAKGKPLDCLVCHCTVCRCPNCIDPNKTKAKAVEPPHTLGLPCDCEECECGPCKDPQILARQGKPMESTLKSPQPVLQQTIPSLCMLSEIGDAELPSISIMGKTANKEEYSTSRECLKTNEDQPCNCKICTCDPCRDPALFLPDANSTLLSVPVSPQPAPINPIDSSTKPPDTTFNASLNVTEDTRNPPSQYGSSTASEFKQDSSGEEDLLQLMKALPQQQDSPNILPDATFDASLNVTEDTRNPPSQYGSSTASEFKQDSSEEEDLLQLMKALPQQQDTPNKLPDATFDASLNVTEDTRNPPSQYGSSTASEFKQDSSGEEDLLQLMKALPQQQDSSTKPPDTTFDASLNVTEDTRNPPSQYGSSTASEFKEDSSGEEDLLQLMKALPQQQDSSTKPPDTTFDASLNVTEDTRNPPSQYGSSTASEFKQDSSEEEDLIGLMRALPQQPPQEQISTTFVKPPVVASTTFDKPPIVASTTFDKPPAVASTTFDASKLQIEADVHPVTESTFIKPPQPTTGVRPDLQSVRVGDRTIVIQYPESYAPNRTVNIRPIGHSVDCECPLCKCSVCEKIPTSQPQPQNITVILPSADTDVQSLKDSSPAGLTYVAPPISIPKNNIPCTCGPDNIATLPVLDAQFLPIAESTAIDPSLGHSYTFNPPSQYGDSTASELLGQSATRDDADLIGLMQQLPNQDQSTTPGTNLTSDTSFKPQFQSTPKNIVESSYTTIQSQKKVTPSDNHFATFTQPNTVPRDVTNNIENATVFKSLCTCNKESMTGYTESSFQAIPFEKKIPEKNPNDLYTAMPRMNNVPAPDDHYTTMPRQKKVPPSDDHYTTMQPIQTRKNNAENQYTAVPPCRRTAPQYIPINTENTVFKSLYSCNDNGTIKDSSANKTFRPQFQNAPEDITDSSYTTILPQKKVPQSADHFTTLLPNQVQPKYAAPVIPNNNNNITGFMSLCTCNHDDKTITVPTSTFGPNNIASPSTTAGQFLPVADNTPADPSLGYSNTFNPPSQYGESTASEFQVSSSTKDNVGLIGLMQQLPNQNQTPSTPGANLSAQISFRPQIQSTPNDIQCTCDSGSTAIDPTSGYSYTFNPPSQYGESTASEFQVSSSTKDDVGLIGLMQQLPNQNQTPSTPGANLSAQISFRPQIQSTPNDIQCTCDSGSTAIDPTSGYSYTFNPPSQYGESTASEFQVSSSTKDDVGLLGLMQQLPNQKQTPITPGANLSAPISFRPQIQSTPNDIQCTCDSGSTAIDPTSGYSYTFNPPSQYGESTASEFQVSSTTGEGNDLLGLMRQIPNQEQAPIPNLKSVPIGNRTIDIQYPITSSDIRAVIVSPSVHPVNCECVQCKCNPCSKNETLYTTIPMQKNIPPPNVLNTTIPPYGQTAPPDTQSNIENMALKSLCSCYEDKTVKSYPEVPPETVSTASSSFRPQFQNAPKDIESSHTVSSQKKVPIVSSSNRSAKVYPNGHDVSCDCVQCKCDPCFNDIASRTNVPIDDSGIMKTIPSAQSTSNRKIEDTAKPADTPNKITPYKLVCDCPECVCSPCEPINTTNSKIISETPSSRLPPALLGPSFVKSPVSQTSSRYEVEIPPGEAAAIRSVAVISPDDWRNLDTNTLKQKLYEMEKEAQERSNEIAQIRKFISGLQCVCNQQAQEVQNPLRTIEPVKSFEQTISGLQCALVFLQEKCRKKDRMIHAFSEELRLRADSGVFNQVLHRLAAEKDLPYGPDYDRYGAANSLPNPVDMMSRQVMRTPAEKPCAPTAKITSAPEPMCQCLYPQISDNIDPAPLVITEVRRIAPDSLLLKWERPVSPAIRGYEVEVNGEVKSRVHSAGRNATVLNGLIMTDIMNLSVVAVTMDGARCYPPATAVYKPRPKSAPNKGDGLKGCTC